MLFYTLAFYKVNNLPILLTILIFKVLIRKERIVDLDNLKALFRSDAEKTIDTIYKDYREEFLNFGIKISENRELVVDAFQDAIIGMYQNLIENRITENRSSVKSYLFEIGKRQLLKAMKKEKMLVLKNEVIGDVDPDTGSKDTVEKERLRKAVSELGETCQKLITLYYYRRYSIDAIMRSLEMKNENSVKANKSRCVKQLKEILSSNLPKSNL